MKKRALSWLLALTMLLTLAPQTLPVWASATGEKSNTATQTESKLSANTYSALGLSRNVSNSEKPAEQPYGKAEVGNTIATNVINELYVNFNGSIHYGWSILDNLTMQWTDTAGSNWTSADNFAGAMKYWRPNQQEVHYKNGNQEEGALFATNKTAGKHNKLGDYINSANKHLVYQYSKSEAFSPNTGKDNYVAELVVSDDGMVSLYIYQVEGGNKRYVRGTNIGKNPYVGDASNKTNVIWNWEYDAMFDIAAGDMDGDGYDEIAVYTATGTGSDDQAVHLYKYTGGTLTEITKKTVTKPNNNNAKDKNLKLGTAVVTLAFGDLNADDKDELVIAENMTYGSSNINDGKVGIYALKEGALERKKEISLETEREGNNVAMARYVNVATGDIDNDNQDELIIAGYVGIKAALGSTNISGTNKDNIYYKIIDGKEYTESDWKTTSFVKKDLLGRVVDNSSQLIPPVSLTCAATQGVGYAEQLFLSGCLYSVNKSNYELTLLTQISTNREYKKDNGNKANKEEIFVVNVVAGNFNGNRNGQEQIVYAFGMKHDDSDRYWYDIGYINKKAPGPENANQSSGYWYGQEQVMNYESSYNRDQNKSRASLYLSLAAVDCDNDSTLMRYKGQTVTWTKPEVLTILQSAPYFQDLEDTRGYINQGQTGYGKGKGSGSSATAGTSLSVGTYVSFEQDFSVFGVKIASIQAEAQTKHSFNYGYEHNQTVETEVNYSGSAGDDYAVVYAVPYMEYQYETWVPGYKLPATKNDEYYKYVDNYLSGKLKDWDTIKTDSSKLNTEREKAEKELGISPNMEVKGSWQPCTVSVPMTPRTVMLSVDDYDDIANVTEGLQPIRGNILNSTPGDPTTYDAVGSRGDKFNAIGNVQTVTKAQGSNISVTQISTKEDKHSFEYEYEFEAKVGAGAGGLTVGVLAGFGANAGGGISKSSSKSYSATVDNLPSDADGYALSWQFGWRKAKLNNNDVLVLEYQQKDTKAKPSPPKNLRVESVTSNSVTLTWDPVTGAGAYVIYQVGADGKQLFEMNTLAGTASSWTNTGLSSNRAYTYVAKTIAQSGEESITSVSVSTSTLEANKDNFKILEQPKEQGEAAAGDSVNMSVSAEYRNEDGSLNDLHYQWETYNTEKKQWESISGAKQPTYTVTVTEKNDGKRYRCQVYSSASLYLYSKEVTLKVGRSATTTSLTSDSFNQTVKSAYLKETKEKIIVDGKEVYEQKQVTETINQTEYDVYLVSEDQYVYLGKDGKYYTKSSNNLTEVGPHTTEFIIYNDMKILKSSLTESQIGTNEQVTYTETKEDGETDTTDLKTYTAINKYTYSYSDNGTDKILTLFYATTTGNAGIYLVEQSGNTTKPYLPVEVETEKTITVDGTAIEISSLQAKMENDTSKPVTKTVQSKEAGDPVELKATISGTKPTGTVTFKIVNTTGDGGAMIDVEVGANGTATTTWTPTTSGIYVVTAIYSGSDTFKESQSDSYTINVVTPGEQKLVLSGEKMTYGDTQELKATLFDGKSASGSTTVTAKPVTVTYTVTRDGTAVTGEISDAGMFTPSQAGTYTITATYTPANTPSTTNDTGDTSDATTNNSITTTKVIVVGRKTVKIVPKVNADKTITYNLPDIPNEDKTTIKNAIDTSCIGLADGAKAGIYPIVVTYKGDTTIDKKYLIVFDNDQKYEVKGDVVHVTNATTDSNGKVKLQYTDNKGNTYDVGENGQTLDVPKGVTLTATAMPNVGYRVEKWTEKVGDNTEALIFSSTDVYNTSNVITKEDLQTKYSIKADFTLTYYNLKMGFATGSSGSIIAKYLNDAGTEGAIFYDSNSPSLTPTTATQQLSPLKKVRITATPAEGQVISGWRIYSGDNDQTGTLVENNGTIYTGNTYTVSSINANTRIEVQTEAKAAKTIKVTLVGQDDANLGSQASVSFNATEATSVDGTYTYTTAQHDNVVINLTIPDSLIVDSWKIGETEQNVGTLSNNKKTLSISNLQLSAESMDLTVHCKAPNSYPVTVTQKIGETTVTNAADITIKKNGTNAEVDTTNPSVPEATILRVIIQEKEGYELQSVSCNGREQTTQDTQGGKAFTIDGVHAGVNIVATFVKLDEYTVTFSVVDTNGDDAGGTNGILTATAERKGKEYPGFKTEDIVYAGSTVTFTAAPDDGYRVKEWQVDGVPYTDARTNTSLTLTPTRDTNVTVQFMEIGSKVTVRAQDNNGSITSAKVENDNVDYTGGFTLMENAQVVITAEPKQGFVVDQWSINGTPAQTGDNSFTYTAQTADTGADITVSFRQIDYPVSWSTDHGTVTAAGAAVNYTGNSANIRGGTTVTFTATGYDGYTLTGWTVNGEQKQSSNSPTFTWEVENGAAMNPATNAFVVKPVFSRGSYTVTLTQPEHATVTVNTDLTLGVTGGTQVTFTAAPAAGYILVGWTVNGTTTNTHDLQHTVTVNSETTVTASIVPSHYNVTYSATGNGSVSAEGFTSSPASVPYGESITFTAVPNGYHHVESWKVNGISQPNTASKNTFTLDNVTANTNVEAVFSGAVQYEVGYKVDGTGGNISAKAGDEPLTLNSTMKANVLGGTKLTFTATPNSDQMVAEWSVNGIEVTRTSMTELGVKMDHYLSNTLTIERLDKAVTVKVKFKTYHGYTIPQNQTGYVIETPATRVPNDTQPPTKIRDNGDLTFTVKPNGKDHYMTIGTLIVNGYDCIANEATTAGLDTQKCDSVSATKNEDGSYTVTITNVKDEVEKMIVAHQVIVGGLTVPAAFAGKEELNSAEKIRTKLEASFTGSKDGMAFYDIALKYYDGTQWVDVNETNFPANGVDVVLPYPTGTDKQDRFQIVHMLTHSGHEGEIERITASNETDGLHFHVNSLSPFGVSWTKYVAPTPGGGGGGGAVSTYTLTFDTNGGSAIDKITKDSGTTIDLATYKPTRTGYTFAGWFSDKALTKAVTSVKLTANTTVYAKWTQNGGTAQNPFVDVKEGAYYYDAVLWAVEQKTTSGTSATTFSPDTSCTRAQMVTFLWRAAGSPKVENGKNPFTDVKADAYYYDAVLWAVEKGVTSGTSATTFSPDATVTRGQTVTFLYRNAGSPEVSGTMPFTDVEADAYYAKAVQWAVQQKITTGTSETTFNPMSDCTRGQIVTFLYRAK